MLSARQSAPAEPSYRYDRTGLHRLSRRIIMTGRQAAGPDLVCFLPDLSCCMDKTEWYADECVRQCQCAVCVSVSPAAGRLSTASVP